MAEKILNTRVQMRTDTAANWASIDPVLLQSEMILVQTANGPTRFKIGDGVSKFSQLPYQDEYLYKRINDVKDNLDVGIFVQSDAPTDPAEGAIWIDTTEGEGPSLTPAEEVEF